MAGDATFGAMLRRHRRQAGLSQEELAARAFVSTRAISDLERGVNARPRLHTAVALADGLGLAGEERVAFERQARPDIEPGDALSPVTPRARPPLALDSFVDDGSSLDELLALVGDRRNRLVTLIGPGGVGKTRLALEMAQRLDGPVAFVALASLSDATLLAATIGDALLEVRLFGLVGRRCPAAHEPSAQSRPSSQMRTGQRPLRLGIVIPDGGCCTAAGVWSGTWWGTSELFELGCHSSRTGRTYLCSAIARPSKGLPTMSGVLLWVVAAILVIVGIVQLLQGQVLLGVVLIVVGCLVGPGGYSVFRSRHA